MSKWPKKHKVVRGDTLSQIAQDYGTTYPQIAADNNIPNPDLIFPGQEFIINRPKPVRTDKVPVIETEGPAAPRKNNRKDFKQARAEAMVPSLLDNPPPEKPRRESAADKNAKRYMQQYNLGTGTQATVEDARSTQENLKNMSRRERDARLKEQGRKDYKSKDRTVDVSHLYNAGLIDDPTMDNAAMAAFGQGMMKLPLSITGSGAKANEGVQRKESKKVDLTSLVSGDYSFTPEKEPWYKRTIGTNVLAENERVSDAPAIERVTQYENQDKLYKPQLDDLRDIYYSFEEYMDNNPAHTQEEYLNFQRIQNLMYEKDASFRAKENAVYMSGEEQAAQERNPLAFGAGNLTTQMLAYQAANAVGAATGATKAIEQGIGGAIGKVMSNPTAAQMVSDSIIGALAGDNPVGKVLAGKAADLAVNQFGDLLVQDIPRLAADLADGVGVGQALKNFGRNELENAAYNVGMDAAFTAARNIAPALKRMFGGTDAAAYLKSVPEATDNAAVQAIRQQAQAAEDSINQAAEYAAQSGVNLEEVLSDSVRQSIDREIDDIIRFNKPHSESEFLNLNRIAGDFGARYSDPAMKSYYDNRLFNRLSEEYDAMEVMLKEQAEQAVKMTQPVDEQARIERVFGGKAMNENFTGDMLYEMSYELDNYEGFIMARNDIAQAAPEKFKEVTDALDVLKTRVAAMDAVGNSKTDGVMRAVMDCNNALNRLNTAARKAGLEEIVFPDHLLKKRYIKGGAGKYTTRKNSQFEYLLDQYKALYPNMETAEEAVRRTAEESEVLGDLLGIDFEAPKTKPGAMKRRASAKELAKTVGEENVANARRYVRTIKNAPDAEIINTPAFQNYKVDFEEVAKQPVPDDVALHAYRNEPEDLLLDYNLQFFAKKADDAADVVGSNIRPESIEVNGNQIPTPEPYSDFDWSTGGNEIVRPQSGDMGALGAIKRSSDNVPPTNSTIEPGQRISKVRTNTMQNAGISNDAELAQEYAEDVYKYATVTEAQSLDDAVQRVSNDFDGALRRYTQDFDAETAAQMGAQDADSMMLIYKDLNRRARELFDAGDTAGANRLYAQAREVTKNMQTAATKSGQYIQAMAKWTRTADGAIATGQGMVDQMVQDALQQNPNLAKDIGKIAETIDANLKSLQATDIWKRLEDGSISDFDKAALKGEIENIINQAFEGSKRAGKRVTPVDISRMADDILEQQWVDVQRQLEMMETGFFDIKPETVEQVEDIFIRMEQYPPNSKERVDLENQMYSIIANDISHGKSFGDKLDAWRYFSMLANPTTHIRNMTGNVLFGLETGVKDNIAAGIESAVDRLSRIKGGNGMRRTKAVLNPMSDADKALKEAARTDFLQNAYRDYSGNKWFDAGRGIDSAMPTWDPNTKFGRFMNAVTDFNTRALNTEDVMAGQRKYADALARYLKANGADASVFRATDDAARDMLDNARAYAMNQAKLATFHQDNKVADSFAQWVRDLKQSNKGAAKVIGMALDVTIPFKRTPANILESVAAYSPLEFAKVITETPMVLRGAMSAADYIDDISKGLTGSAGLAIGAWLAREGILHVNHGSDNEIAFDKMTGKQDMSINIGDYSIKISELAPASVPLIEGAIIFNHFLSGEKDPDSALNTIVDATTAMAESVTDMTMLQGISDALSNVRYAQSDTDIWESLGTGIASNTVSQMLPTLGGKIERVLDPYQRSTYSDKTGAAKKIEQNAKYWTQKIPGAQALGETLQGSDIPILQGAGDALAREHKLNARGEAQENFGGNAIGRGLYNMLSPATITKNSSTENDNEIRRLAEATGRDDLYTHISTQEAKVGNEYQMTPKEWTQYQADKGQFQTELETAFFGSDAYKGMSDADRAETLKRLHTFAKDYCQNRIHEKNLSSDAQKLSEALEEGGVDAVLKSITGKAAAKGAGYQGNTVAAKVVTQSAEDGKDVQEVISGLKRFEKDGLKDYDYRHFQQAQDRIPTLTEDWYVDAYKGMDVDPGNPNKLTQQEIIDAMNANKGEAEKYRDVFWTNPRWKKIPVLGDNGEWQAR